MLNAALGFSQEQRAEQSMAALKRMAAPVVRVRREGQVLEIPALALVPGDGVLLETGAARETQAASIHPGLEAE